MLPLVPNWRQLCKKIALLSVKKQIMTDCDGMGGGRKAIIGVKLARWYVILVRKCNVIFYK